MKKILLIITITAFTLSCSNDDGTKMNEDNFTEAAAKGFGALKMDFETPVTYNYFTEEDKDRIISGIIDEIYEVELKSHVDGQGQTVSEEININLLINTHYKTIVLSPKPISVGVVVTTGDDNKKCGGEAGDGWKLYGTCYDAECVEDKSKAAAEANKNNLTAGKCLDIRVKRNALNARVCARVINC